MSVILTKSKGGSSTFNLTSYLTDPNTQAWWKFNELNVGDSSDNYCIRIADADPTIIIKRSYAKANGSNPTIYWDTINNDNLKIAFSAIMHGALSTNVPFGRSGSQTPIVNSHHNIYNADPFASIWTNNITGSNDTFDPDGDF